MKNIFNVGILIKEKIMSNLTRIAIGTSFKKLLEEKPLKKITIQDIVDDCGINRNTFYYHFHDIPFLLESLLKDDFDKLILENPDINSIEDCLNTVSRFIEENKIATLHIYKSINRDIFEKFQWRICDYAVNQYLSKQFPKVTISEDDKDIILLYIKSLCFGVIMGWLENDLKNDIQPFIHRICELKQGELDIVLEKCRIK